MCMEAIHVAHVIIYNLLAKPGMNVCMCSYHSCPLIMYLLHNAAMYIVLYIANHLEWKASRL